MITVTNVLNEQATIDETLTVKSKDAAFQEEIAVNTRIIIREAGGSVNALAFLYYGLLDLGYDVAADAEDLAEETQREDTIF